MPPADCYKDDRFNQEQDKKTGFRTNNMLAMPLKAGMEVVGVMQLINKHLGAFADADEGMLETFLTIAATHVKASSVRAPCGRPRCRPAAPPRAHAHPRRARSWR